MSDKGRIMQLENYSETLEQRVLELRAEIERLREFIVAWVDLDSFTPEQPEFKLYRECQSALESDSIPF